MRQARCLSLLAFPVALSAQTATELPRFVRWPDIHGDQVVFTYEDDLWLGSLQGGPARRLTSHPGVETTPKFSPDGKWIAFSGQYDAGQNVYVMPANGGSPRRLTWHGPCAVVGWSPDSSKVLFRTWVEVDCRPISRVFSVDLEGHEPQALPLGKAIQAAYAPDSSHLLFTPKGDGEYYWKRYRGGQHPELWDADLKAGTYRKVTHDPGKSAYPMFTATGGALFLSDRGPGGISNLYALDTATGAAKALTAYTDFDVQFPSTDGHRVVFEQAGYLGVLDLATGASRRLEITAPTDAWRMRPRTVHGKDTLQQVRLGAGGKTLPLRPGVAEGTDTVRSCSGLAPRGWIAGWRNGQVPCKPCR